MDLLYEPLKFYNQFGKSSHEENCKQLFEDLVSKSGINKLENKNTVKEYNYQLSIIDKIGKTISRNKGLRVFSIILIVLSSLISIFTAVSNLWLYFALSLVLSISLLLLIFLVLNKNIKSATKKHEIHQQKADELLKKAHSQMLPLNALFDEKMTLRLIEKTLPCIKFNERFTKAQEKFFISNHDFIDLQKENCSMLDTLSGTINENPFVFCRRLVQEERDHVYHGSKVISWTETYRDSNGRLRTRTRTQTLHASLVKPEPCYNHHTYLAYGNQAAPDLTFTRTATHVDDLSEGQLARKIRKGKRKLNKQAKKALAKGENFQEMTNTEFDVLFGATDRNHEVQFRLMYTPLGQRNTVDLLKDNVNYGDDFSFEKLKRFNVITSEHAQHWKMSTHPIAYQSYDFEAIEKNFIGFNNEYFKSVFFDFAPLLCVPAYHEEPSASMEEFDDYDSNYTYYEHEILANVLGDKHFEHEDSKTPCILKTSVNAKNDKIDSVSVKANSFATINRVDFVPVLGGDGRMHPVPVPWIEYVPVNKTTVMSVSDLPTKNENISSVSSVYYHGLYATPIK